MAKHGVCPYRLLAIRQTPVLGGAFFLRHTGRRSMKLEIERRFVESLVGAFPRLASWKEQLRLGRKIEVPYDLLTAEELTFLELVAKYCRRKEAPPTRDAFRRCAMFRGMDPSPLP
jgi:hypothetical protein